jgi:hypothetical protein
MEWTTMTDSMSNTPTGDILYEEWPIPLEFPVQIAAQELAKNTYRTAVGKSGKKFYIPDGVPNPADNIYCTESDDWDTPGSGFAGRTLVMECVDEDGNVTTEQLKGGWHSNAEALFQETGVDIRDKHKTFVVVAYRRDAENFYDVVFVDSGPVVGLFQRGEHIATELANKLETPLVCFSRSAGGAVIGMVYPVRKAEG